MDRTYIYIYTGRVEKRLERPEIREGLRQHLF
jgi:hypothetical protein